MTQSNQAETLPPRAARRERKRLPEAPLRIERRHDGQLWASRGDRSRPVSLHRCFPWSEPARHISLRDPDEEEFALVRDPTELDAASRVAFEGGLREAGFVLEIEHIEEVEEEVEIRSWKVRTRQGRRSFQTRRDDWPREIPGGGLLIRDVAGDLFLIRDPQALDPQSRDWLWVFVD